MIRFLIGILSIVTTVYTLNTKDIKIGICMFFLLFIVYTLSEIMYTMNRIERETHAQNLQITLVLSLLEAKFDMHFEAAEDGKDSKWKYNTSTVEEVDRDEQGESNPDIHD